MSEVFEQLTHDAAVQSTTDDASISKLSAVQKGYFDDQYLQFVTKKATRRSPLINRGYYARVSGIRKVIHKFLQLNVSGEKVQFVSLGAGNDTTFFWLDDVMRTKYTDKRMAYFEIDFPEVTFKKIHTIIRHEEMCSKLGDKVDVENGRNADHTCINTEKLKVIGVDLRDIKGLGIISDYQFDPTLPTFFLSECVMVYLDPANSDAVIKWAASVTQGPTCFVIYEQILPSDAFGRTMVKNLHDRGCPLMGIHTYPTIAAQMERFNNLGWDRCFFADMNDVYDTHIDREDIKRIQKLEIFDEFEEWRLIQAHYFIGVAIKDGPRDSPSGIILDDMKSIWES